MVDSQCSSGPMKKYIMSDLLKKFDLEATNDFVKLAITVVGFYMGMSCCMYFILLIICPLNFQILDSLFVNIDKYLFTIMNSFKTIKLIEIWNKNFALIDFNFKLFLCIATTSILTILSLDPSLHSWFFILYLLKRFNTGYYVLNSLYFTTWRVLLYETYFAP